MKKIKLIFISLLAIFGIVTLAGCSSKDDNTDELEAKIAELEETNSNLSEENENGSGVRVTQDTIVETTGTHMLYAKWIIHTHTITLTK